jgi:preprotein translocase subunit SecD
MRSQDGVLTIRLPGAKPEMIARVKTICSTRGDLQLCPVAPKDLQMLFNREKTIPEGYRVVDSSLPSRGVEYEAYGAKILVRKEPVIDGRHILHSEATEVLNPQGPAWPLTLTLNPDGAKRFDDEARKLYDLQPTGLLAVLLDGVLKSAPAIQSSSFRGIVPVPGAKSLEDAADLSLILASGVLPVPVQVEGERLYGPKK